MTNKEEARSAILKTGTTVSGAGYLLTMDGTSNTLDLVTWGETVLGVSADDSERDSTGLVIPTSWRSYDDCFKGFSNLDYWTSCICR